MPRQAVLPAGTSKAVARLLNDWQRDFPLEERPFAAIGRAVGIDEQGVLECFAEWQRSGLVSRIGAVIATGRLGASALVALSVPPERLEAVAERVNAEQGVNHNYEREHRFNLWFVAAAPSTVALAELVRCIEADTACEAIVLPMMEEYHIDLGFDLHSTARRRAPLASPVAHGIANAAVAFDAGELRLLANLQQGLAIEVRPYVGLARSAGLSEGRVFRSIGRWLESGLLRRFGVVLRHHEFGISSNAMCVWDVPDEVVGDIGRALAEEPAVTLCYRRSRALPHWPYNLFCMIHGSEREAVVCARNEIAARLGLDGWPHEVLFSRRRFKQKGACYFPIAREACHA